MLLVTRLSVDGSHALYWRSRNSTVLELMRHANFFASLPLHDLCGFVWLYR